MLCLPISLQVPTCFNTSTTFEAYKKTSFTIRRVKEKIQQTCDMQGTTVGEELHNNQEHAMAPFDDTQVFVFAA